MIERLVDKIGLADTTPSIDRNQLRFFRFVCLFEQNKLFFTSNHHIVPLGAPYHTKESEIWEDKRQKCRLDPP